MGQFHFRPRWSGGPQVPVGEQAPRTSIAYHCAPRPASRRLSRWSSSCLFRVIRAGLPAPDRPCLAEGSVAVSRQAVQPESFSTNQAPVVTNIRPRRGRVANSVSSETQGCPISRIGQFHFYPRTSFGALRVSGPGWWANSPGMRKSGGFYNPFPLTLFRR